MNMMISEFDRVDPGTLGWVKAEIDKTLIAGRSTLEAFLEDGDDRSGLRSLANQLHQVVGTLQMVELDGTAQLAHEIELLVDTWIDSGDPLPADAAAAVREGLESMSSRLAELEAHGGIDLAIHHVATLNRLRAVRGEVEIDPYTLFNPELELAPPREEQVPKLDDAEFRDRVRGYRRSYQAGLLAWLRRPEGLDTLAGLADTAGEMRVVARFEASARLWWVAEGYLRMLAALPSLAADDPRMRLPARLDQMMRQMVEQGESAAIGVQADELTRSMLYFIGSADARTEMVAQVDTAFGLGEYLGRAAAVDQVGRQPEQLVELAQRGAADLKSARDALDDYANADRHERQPKLSELADHMTALAEVAVDLDLESVAVTCRTCAELALRMSDGGTIDREAAVLKMAAAILFLEGLFGAPEEPNTNWRELCDEHSDRLRQTQDSAAGEVPPAHDAGVLDSGERKRLLATVAQEIYVNLARAEDALESFAADPTRRELLQPAAAELRQIRGALWIWDEQAIDELIVRTVEQLVALGEDLLMPSAALMEALAVAVGTIESYVRGLEQDRRDLPLLVERAMHDLEDATREPAADRIDGAAVLADVRVCMDTWLANDSDFEAFRMLRKHLRDLTAVSEARGKTRLRRAAQETLQLLDIVTEDPGCRSPEMEQALSRSVDKLGLRIDDLLDAPRGQGQSDTQVDQSLDILAVFIEEAAECVAVIDEQLSHWRAHLEDTDALTTVRRAFHSIKGSGRMAEAGIIAELAWTVEDVLNQVIDGDLDATGTLLDFVRDAARTMDELVVNQLHGDGDIDLSRWQQRAARLSNDSCPETPAAPANAAAGESESVDGVVNVYAKEARGHLATIREYLSRCRHDEASSEVTAELTRALHTLAGSSRSMSLSEMSDAYSGLDDLLGEVRGAGGHVQPGEFELMERMVELSAQVVERIATGEAFSQAERRTFADLTTAIAARRDERRLPGHLDQAAGSPAAPIDGQVAFETSAASASQVLQGDELALPVGAIGHSIAATPPAMRVEPDSHETVEMGGDPLAGIENVFVDEAEDILTRVDAGLQQWRDTGDWAVPVAQLKRDLHTLKGGARAAGAAALGDLSHQAETLLEQYERRPDDESIATRELLEEVHDTLAEGVRCVAEGVALPGLDDLYQRLSAADETKLENAQSETPTAESVTAQVPPPATDQIRTVRVKSQVLDKLFDYAGEVSVSRSQIQQQLVGLKSHLKDLRGNVARFSEQLRELEIQAETQIHARRLEHERLLAEHGGQGDDFDPLQFDRYTSLQELTRGLSESLDDLASIENALNQFANQTESSLQQQANISGELQERLMSIRMVPFSRLLPRLRHQVRQTTRELDKEAELTVAGAEVEIDRNVLDGLVETLEHMIRNAIDHGIEAPQVRTAQGKPAMGRIHIECRQTGNEIVLEFSDDGAGLDLPRIRRRAQSMELLDGEAPLNDQELIRLIVTAGFTTTDRITKLSGRGVGLDVVNNAVRAIGGSIHVTNRVGEGATFVLKLPISLSITQALFVRCADQEVAFSVAVLDRIIKVGPDQFSEVAEDADGCLVYDGESYPVMDLALRLGLETKRQQDDRIPMILVRMGARQVAVRVDEVLGTREVVVKPVGEYLAPASEIVGATVLGDGNVVLIVDLGTLWMMPAQSFVRPEPVSRREAPVVMVVDDSLTVRKVTGRNLERMGSEVMMARDGVDALEQIGTTRPDLMLVDIEMPRMDGYELTERIRGGSRTRDIPIVIITSRGSTKHRDKAISLGANAYLTKPYQEAQLVEQVRQFLPQELVAELA